MSNWIVEKRTSIFRTGIFELESLNCRHPEKPDSHTFFILNSPDWINVVAVDEEGRFITVNQHRLGTGECTIETPAGLIEPGEAPETAACRELLEETGYVPGELRLMKRLSANPAIMNNHIYFFRATGCRKAASQDLDAAEDIEVQLLTRDEIQAMLDGGEINHSIIVTALMLFFSGN